MNIKTNKSFMLGFFCGSFFVFLLVLVPVYRNRGDTIGNTKKFGDIKIVPFEVEQKLLPGTDTSLGILRDDKTIMTFYFNSNKKLKSLSFINDDKILFSASRSIDFNGWLFFHYGNYETGSDYFDKNCDGILDSFFYCSENFIFINGEWLKVDYCRGKSASINGGDIKREFVFTSEDGWQEKTSQL